MNPQNLKYHEEHAWARVDGDTAVFGVTDYAQEALGEIVYIGLPAVGSEVVAGTPYAEVESVKAVSDVFAPLSGSVVEVNEEAVDAPELINESPFDDAWLVKVRLDDAAEQDGLMTAQEYERFLAEGED